MALFALYNDKVIPLINDTTVLKTQYRKMRTNLRIVHSDDFSTDGLKFETYKDGLRLLYSCAGFENDLDSLVVIPSNIEGKKVAYIKDSAFSGWPNGNSTIQTVIIPDSIEEILSYSFQLCTGLTSVTIGKNVTNIADAAFSSCTSLTNISFNGTKAQWNAINKGVHWNSGVPVEKIICSDGEVSL